MRTFEEHKRIMELWDQGYNKLQISDLLNISRSTVRDAIARYQTLDNLLSIIAENEAKIEVMSQPKPIIPRAEPIYHQPVRKYSPQQLEEAVKTSTSIAQVLTKLGLKPAGGNYDLIKRRIQEYGLDTSHFTGKGWLKGKRVIFQVHFCDLLKVFW